MQIKYCPIEGGNFGDTLNTMVWDRLFPDLTQRKESILVYGIGTLLDGRHDRTLKKIVLGSGLGEAGAALPDPNWDFRWVRVRCQPVNLAYPVNWPWATPRSFGPRYKPRVAARRAAP